MNHIRISALSLAVATAFCAGSALAQGAVTQNPYSPANGHPYRHGVLPTLNVHAAMQRWEKAHAMSSNSKTLAFGGGTGGVGVMSGTNKVYLVFYGTQWGTSSTDANGNLAFTGDSTGSAGAAQQMFKGIGTNGETWQAELTQWCDGAGVSNGATSCPSSGVNFVPYQKGILAGVWYDNAKASPATATAAQLANEAIAAAAHFGNTTTASNRYAYYVILSPHGTNPDNYQGQYCAWHDYTADAGVTSPYGEMAFSNQPYNTDSGSGCGVNFVNSGSAGKLDGFTMTLGHEWHEMMSDQFPSGGWQNHGTGTYAGQENSDECAWIAAGQTGGAANVTFDTGTFTEQASYSNDTASCSISHAILHTVVTVPTANFSFTTSGLTANFTDGSSDVGGTITGYAWDFGDGSSSIAANPSHAYAAGGTYSVTETVTDSGSVTANKTASVSVVAPPVQLVKNPAFENASAWNATDGVLCYTGCAGESAFGGVGFAKFGGLGTAHTDRLSQTITIPAGLTSATLKYFLHVDTQETTGVKDTLHVMVYSGTTLLQTLNVWSNLDHNTGYSVHTNDLGAYIGQTITLRFTGIENASAATTFTLDNVTLTAQ